MKTFKVNLPVDYLQLKLAQFLLTGDVSKDKKVKVLEQILAMLHSSKYHHLFSIVEGLPDLQPKEEVKVEVVMVESKSPFVVSVLKSVFDQMRIGAIGIVCGRAYCKVLREDVYHMIDCTSQIANNLCSNNPNSVQIQDFMGNNILLGKDKDGKDLLYLDSGMEVMGKRDEPMKEEPVSMPDTLMNVDEPKMVNQDEKRVVKGKTMADSCSFTKQVRVEVESDDVETIQLLEKIFDDMPVDSACMIKGRVFFKTIEEGARAVIYNLFDSTQKIINAAKHSKHEKHYRLVDYCGNVIMLGKDAEGKDMLYFV